MDGVFEKRGARKIILYGISMGAATALMSLKRVKVDGVVADCPFDSPFSAFEYTAKSIMLRCFVCTCWGLQRRL